MNFSKRVLNMQESPIRKLIPYSDEAKQKGKKVYHLNIGQPDLKTPEAFFDAIKDKTEKNDIVSYSHSAGLMELREAFSDYYKKWNIPLEKEEIIITTGGSEAIIFALGSVADPGDEIIVIEPFYANYRGFSEMLNLKLVPVRATPETGYAVPNKEMFENVITKNTKAIIFSNPSNPTGAVYTKEEISIINEIAKEHDLYIISDEVYKEFTFDGKKHISIMNFDDYDKYIIVDSISKRYSACGARIGVFATKNKKLYSQAMKFAQSRLCSPLIAQYGTIGLLKNVNDKYMEDMINEYTQRRDIVYEELSKIEGAVFKKPHGSFYVSVELPIDDSEKFIKWMLKDFDIDGETVMVAPLDGFYNTEGAGKKEIRIAYVLEKEKLKKACYILKEGVNEYNKIYVK
ncbi:aspartate aminotransferase [Oceanotoga teriensis]|uniref:Aminotransferase n=1 Tax=Oceanotoga teriensis TaxID=515440 RepID=A0AA45C8K6_9BACT|nr:pyridoxal phosphate-dependent aminotransferase [Oceanotoga teriensis]PWJ96138.1 aspartate aminotransferase [Oceanotoga teriensis]